MTEDKICPTCGHRPHQPLGCKARYRVTFERDEPGERCLCENWRGVAHDHRPKGVSPFCKICGVTA